MPIIIEPARFTKEAYRTFLVSYPHVKALFDEAGKQRGLPIVEETSMEVMVHVTELTDDQQRKIGAAAMRELKRHLAQNRGKAWSLPHIIGAAAGLLLMGWLLGIVFGKDDGEPLPLPAPTPAQSATATPPPKNTPLSDIDFAFNSAMLADMDAEVEAEQKVENWEKFLTGYAQDDPATTHDDELRRAAAAKKAQWQQSATPTPKPTAAPSLPKEWKDPVTGMEFVLIPAGEFIMGTNCPNDDPFTEANEFENCGWKDEHPAHRVVIKEPFYMGKYEVTQEEWYNVMGNNPSEFKSEKVGMNSRRHPVENISWNDAQEFVKRLNAQSSGVVFRLPSEAEWEYAARAGTSTEYSFGDDAARLGDYAWYYDNSYVWYSGNYNYITHPVGEKLPNPFGLFDMHGNVWEWLADPWHENYNGAPTDGSAWGTLGDEKAKVLRGGSWYVNRNYCRSASRYGLVPDFQNYYYGCRVVAVPLRTE